MKRDRPLFAILSLVLANLVVWLGYTITALYHSPANEWYWTRLIADAIAIIALLWIMRTYLKGRKAAKQREAEAKKDDR